MRLRLRDGDYVPDGAGGFVQLEISERLLEQALFRLTARRGGFAPIPELGSRLYLLHRAKADARNTLAKTYAQEALTPMGLRVTETAVEEQEDTLFVKVTIKVQGNEEELEVMIH